MALYALGLMPLLWKLNSSEETADQVGYADDLQCISKLKMMRKYYDICSTEGPKYGFFLELFTIMILVLISLYMTFLVLNLLFSIILQFLTIFAIILLAFNVDKNH